jgi:hypothetical protein
VCFRFLNPPPPPLFLSFLPWDIWLNLLISRIYVYRILILQVARSSKGVIGEDVYLIGVWAVAICTVIGPIAFSSIIKRRGSVVVYGRWGTPGADPPAECSPILAHATQSSSPPSVV